MAFLEVKNLTVAFKGDTGWNEAIHNVSFSVDKGQKVAIVGESGSGKSVTSLSVMGLLPIKNSKVVSGEVFFDGDSLFELSHEERRKLKGNEMSMIFQEPMTSLNPLLTCGEQVLEVLKLHKPESTKELEKRTLELFKQVKLPRPEKMLSSYPHELSGGQKQRVMIAMAMACGPKLLIADEPTTALDVTVQGEILELIDELVHEHQMACVFITHDLGLVKQFADQVLVMYRGKVVEYGNTLEVFNSPREQYTKGLIASKPNLTTNTYRLPTVSDFASGDVYTRLKSKKVHRGTQVILEIEDLTVNYITRKNWMGKILDSVCAVNNVSFNVFKGETLGLVGESGCGKTTVGRTVLGLEKPTNGNIFFEGESVVGLSSKGLKKYWNDVQIIFQDPYSSLNPRLTIGGGIMEVMTIHNMYDNDNEREKETIRLLEKVGLSAEHYQRFPHEFSGGQRQRICIARTLAMRPKLIICDESVSALDVSVQAQVLNLLNDLKEEFDLTYIFISHDLSVVKYMSDRMLVMKSGELIEIGKSEDLYESPKEEYTKKLLSAIPGV